MNLLFARSWLGGVDETAHIPQGCIRSMTFGGKCYLHWKGRGFAPLEDRQGRGIEGFGASASGVPEPFFTMPNTSDSLAAGKQEMKQEGKGKMSKQTKKEERNE